MSIESRLEALEKKIDTRQVPGRSWDMANLPSWPVEEFYNPETRTIIIEFDGEYYFASVLNAGILTCPDDTFRYSALWFHQGDVKSEPKNPKPSPYNRDSALVSQWIKDGSVKVPQSFVFLVDKSDFELKSVNSGENASFKVDTPIYDKFNGFEKVIPGEKGTGIYFGKDGSILIKGIGGEIAIGPNGISYGSAVQRNSTNEIEGGLMQTNPLRFLPSFAVLPLAAMIPNMGLALKAASISGTIVDAAKMIDKLRDLA